MKVSDYIIKFTENQGIKYVFGVTGGAIAHVFDSIGKNPNVEYICNQHEQASAMAADAYSRVSENLGVAIATSGPGATNLITGICCSYYDSVPVLFITGQVSTSRLAEGKGVRQLGFQETNIVEMVKPVTKYASLIKDAKMIKYELEKAVYIAKSERPGPVLIDIPDNLQREEINPEELESFSPQIKETDITKIREQAKETIILISNAKRPVLILGSGIRLGKATKKARELIERLQIPVLATWGAKDIIQSDNALFIGTFGTTGSRYGNFSVQNSDLIISLGARLDTHATGIQRYFAPVAKKIIVDIDAAELEKFNELNTELLIHANVRDFLELMNEETENFTPKDISEWKNKINLWKAKYPLCLKEYYSQKEKANAYVFFKVLSRKLNGNEIIIADTGENLTQAMNTLDLKDNQRLFSAFNNTPMGYSLPASIGASFAKPSANIICIVGDGGLQMNIQELATIKKHNLPIKIFIFDNKGYNMIKETQNQWLNANYQASCEEKGLAFPEFTEVAKAYNIKANKISNNDEIEEKIKEVLEFTGPFLCDLEISSKPCFLTLRYGMPLEDLSPCLNPEELKENMDYLEKERSKLR